MFWVIALILVHFMGPNFFHDFTNILFGSKLSQLSNCASAVSLARGRGGMALKFWTSLPSAFCRELTKRANIWFNSSFCSPTTLRNFSAFLWPKKSLITIHHFILFCIIRAGALTWGEVHNGLRLTLQVWRVFRQTKLLTCFFVVVWISQQGEQC